MRIQQKVWTVRAAILIGMGFATSSALAQLPREVSKPLDEAKALVDRANQKLNGIADQAEKDKVTLVELTAMADNPKFFPDVIQLASEAQYRMTVAAKESQSILQFDLVAAALAVKDATDAADANGLSNEILWTVKALNIQIKMATVRAQDLTEETQALAKAFAALIDKATVKK